MNFKEVDAYLHRVSPKSDNILKSMESYARRHNFPIVGPLVGRWLYQMALVSGAREIFELGSGFGYSAYWFSLAVGNKGKIVMTDLDDANRERALKFFKDGRLNSKFDFHVGDAFKAARSAGAKYDIVFNDIEKEDYPASIDVAARLLRSGGLFITDNIIWDGQVYDSRFRDKATIGIRKFTRQLYADKRFFTTILPLRDGLTLALRK